MSSPSEETNSFSFGRMLSTMYEKNACADAPFCKKNIQNNSFYSVIPTEQTLKCAQGGKQFIDQTVKPKSIFMVQ